MYMNIIKKLDKLIINLQLDVGSLDEFYYLSILEVSEIHINGLTSVDPILVTLGDLRGVPAGILSQQELV